jgi:hypothetical protein
MAKNTIKGYRSKTGIPRPMKQKKRSSPSKPYRGQGR